MDARHHPTIRPALRPVPASPDPVETFIRAWRSMRLAVDGTPQRELFERVKAQFERDFPKASPAQHRRAISVIGRVCRIERFREGAS